MPRPGSTRRVGRRVARGAGVPTALLLSLLAAAPAAAQLLQPPPDSGTVAVGAVGEVAAVPGRFTLRVAFEGQDADGVRAIASATAKRDRAVAALRELGLPAEAVIRIGAGYGDVAPGPGRRPPDPDSALPRQALTGLRVDVAADRLEAVLSALAGAGMRSITYMAVEPADRDAAEREAVRQAVAMARIRAEALAAASGARLGAVRSLVSTPDLVGLEYRYMGAGIPYDQFARLIPGDVTVRVAVHVAWQLVQ